MMIAEKAADIILGANRSPLTTPRSSGATSNRPGWTLSRSQADTERSRRWASTVKPVAAAILCSALSSPASAWSSSEVGDITAR